AGWAAASRSGAAGAGRDRPRSAAGKEEQPARARATPKAPQRSAGGRSERLFVRRRPRPDRVSIRRLLGARRGGRLPGNGTAAIFRLSTQLIGTAQRIPRT